jgi:hypothetical protein
MVEAGIVARDSSSTISFHKSDSNSFSKKKAVRRAIMVLLKLEKWCPKSSPSHLYRWAKGGGTPSFHRIFYYYRR